MSIMTTNNLRVLVHTASGQGNRKTPKLYDNLLFALIICFLLKLDFSVQNYRIGGTCTLLKSVLHGERTIFYDQVERAPRTNGSSSIATIMAGYNMNRIFVSK